MSFSPPSIRQDRANHYAYGSWASLAGFDLASAFPGYVPPNVAALASAALVGAIQELRPGGNRSPVDFAWTAGGGVPVFATATYLG